MDNNIKTGSCLCNEVKYEIAGNMGIFQYCHCSRCRKFTGSAFASNLFVNPDDFKWTSGSEQVGRFEFEESKHFATCFCKACGSSLPWLAKSGQVVVVPAGTLDCDPDIKPIQNIFCGSSASWFENPADLPKFDELSPRKTKS